MLRIHKITSAQAPANAKAIAEVQALIRQAFAGMPEADIAKLPTQLDNPFRQRFVTELLVASDAAERIKGAAVLLHDPDLRFSYLDVVLAAPKAQRGVGGALYDRVRQEASERGSQGLYFECLPDDPETSPDPETRRQNAARLRFYERYGARPIVGTAYQMPLREGDTDMPFLMFDGLGRHTLPDARHLRAIVRAILERKYADLCPPEYVAKVVGSIMDGPLGLRPPRYTRKPAVAAASGQSGRTPYPLVVNDRHDIHHVRERGYVEAPIRIAAILDDLRKTGLFREIAPRPFPERWIRAVHDGGLVDYVERACREAPEGKSVYPYIFPIRNPARKPKERSVLAGYWCIDTFTPLNRNAWPAARRAVDCALTAADAVLTGAPMAYALVRPPGHHAERQSFGGFCYLSNAAIAANYLSHYGPVAMLDIDYHHGNGQQDIFYERADVLTVSIHGDPSFAYPYFTGFRNETGRNAGAGFNLNLPLAETITPEIYREALDTALRRIARHKPAYLVVCLGFDTGRGDPTGTWPHRAEDFRRIGETIGAAGYPTVIVQEGGYRVRSLGSHARNFFEGFAARHRLGPPAGPPAARPRPQGRSGRDAWRESVRADDAGPIRELVGATGMFTGEEVQIAGELVEERVAKGRVSGYEFVLLEREGRLVGYACFGEVPGAEGSFDLYWIAVDPALQGQGAGQRILQRAEAAMRRLNAARIYADTSGRPDYAPTRRFYERAGYREAARLSDFYRPGDDKVIFEKRLVP